MKRHALWVEFDIREGQMRAFLEEAQKDARGAIDSEPGCLRFDILQDPGDARRAWFYEVYDSEASHKLHRETAHFKAFNEASGDIVESKRVLRLECDEVGT